MQSRIELKAKRKGTKPAPLTKRERKECIRKVIQRGITFRQQVEGRREAWEKGGRLRKGREKESIEYGVKRAIDCQMLRERERAE